MMKTWILRWGPAILVMAIIFFASATPAQDIPNVGAWDFIAKKGSHMLGYALLAIAYLHALRKRENIELPQLILALFLACLYAASDEWHQRFTPGRGPSIQDVCIDGTGAAIGLTLRFWRVWVRKNSIANVVRLMF